jgi:Fuc2NAc and GlcNAc transferase
VAFKALLVLSAMVLAAALTGAMRSLALVHGVLDLPNERSSHEHATPRGGGASIVLVVSIAAVVLAARGALDSHLALALLVGGAAVATVGFLDDREALPPGVRLIVHLAAATWAVIRLGGLPPLQIGDQVVQLGLAGDVLAVLGIVWTLNLFNFMDGIDGIAASEAIFVALGGALLTPSLVNGPGVGFAALVFAAACGGFLLWNWPPASIFLGDVGSGYLGYVIAVLALSASRDNPVALWVWLILGGTFFADATVTLVRRLLQGERVHQAHCCHAYQWLARRWGSHRKVTLALLGVNAVWLFPWAVLARTFPRQAAVSAVAALAPLALLVAVLGAGRAQDSRPE